MRRLAIGLIVALKSAGGVQATLPTAPKASMPVATFSIVARDPATGELGVAPKEALARLLAADSRGDVRQVAFVDGQGRAAVHTGANCIPGAGYHLGDGFTTQANLMLTSEVPDAMATAFTAAKGPLAERMLAALDAARRAGGDVRGKQSAAILVVRARATEKPWTDRLIDLRVEDHPEPLRELRRLLTMHREYELMNRGDDALPLFSKAFRMNPSWMLLVPRLPGVGQLPSTPGIVQRTLAVGPRPDPTAK